MKVYSDTSEINGKNVVVTVGSFDGLHLGHLEIIDQVKKTAELLQGDSFVVTFNPHPRQVIQQDFQLKILTSLEEKQEVFAKAGIQNLMVINFTKEFSQFTSDEFIKKIIVDKLDAKHMVIGHDHKFGRDRLGDENKLIEVGRQFGFDVAAVSAKQIDGVTISSTQIRNSLLNGNLDKANLFLGRNYSLKGIVVKGAHRGRTLGFPTANIKTHEPNKVIPKTGVYLVRCFVKNEIHYGVMNIGYRPTFGDIQEIVMETFILNFNSDIYGADIKVEFLHRIRDEQKFSSKDELIKQIESDINEAVKFVERQN